MLGDTFLSFSIEVLLMTHRNFFSNPRVGDAVSFLGYSAVGYLFVPDCREVISCCEWFIPCVNCSHWVAISSQDHIGLGSVVSELSCQCLSHLSLGEEGKLHLRTWAAGSGNWGFGLFHTMVWIQRSVCPDILNRSLEASIPNLRYILLWFKSSQKDFLNWGWKDYSFLTDNEQNILLFLFWCQEPALCSSVWREGVPFQQVWLHTCFCVQ